jgi:hypothetical protein
LLQLLTARLNARLYDCEQAGSLGIGSREMIENAADQWRSARQLLGVNQAAAG